MKNYVLFVLLGLVFSLASCSKEEITPDATQTPDDVFQFSKDVTLSNAQNTVTMRIHSDNEVELAAYTTRNFDLIPILEGQTSAEAMAAAGITEEGVNTDEQNDGGDNEITKPNTAFEVVAKNLAPGVRSYLVQFKTPESAARAWSYNWHYGQKNVDETMSITRSSYWNRVYFGMSYKATSSSSYSTIISDWRKLSNNETVTRTRSNCYKLRLHVKYRSSSNYTVEFTH